MLPDNFHFIRPYWLLALSILLLLPLYAGQNARILSSWKKACDAHLLKRLLSGDMAKSSYIPVILLIIGWVSGVIALAGPTWEKYPTPVYNITEPTIFVLDASSYMGEKDLPPNRLKRAIYKIDDYIKAQQGGPFGLVLYADDAYVIVPLSYDAKIITNLLPNIDLRVMPQDGARIDRAINIASDNLKNSGATSGKILLLSSGECEGLDDAIKSADAAEQAGFRVHAIGIYTNKKDDRLSYIAKAGKGIYSTISNSDSDISAIVKDVNLKDSNMKQLAESTKKMDIWKDMGRFIVFIPLVCMLFAFRKGWLVCLFLTFILSASPAHAFSWQDLWLNQSQKAEKAVKAEEYKKASQLFKDASRKAASYYKQGDYKKAIELLKDSSKIEDKYNLGNAYAKSGDVEKAITTYENLLKEQPEHADAKYNLEYLKKQQQKSGGGSNSQSKQNQSQGDKQDQQSSTSQNNQDKQKQENKDANSSQDEQSKQGDEQKQDTQNQSENSDKQEQASSKDSQQSKDHEQTNKDENEQNSEEQQNTSEADKQQQQDDGQANPSRPQEQKQGDFDNQALTQVPDEEANGKPDERKLSHEQYYSVIEQDPSGLIRNMILMQYRQRAMENR